MAAFDRISCGIPELDTVFDHIRLGDNVVWQLSSLDNFPYFAKALGAPENFRITVRELKVSAGAHFVVALTGSVLTMILFLMPV